MKKRVHCIVFLLFSAAIHCLWPTSPLQAESFKYAAIYPEGTAGLNILKELVNRLRIQSNDEILIKVYPGNIVGDEEDILRNLKVGRIDIALLTGNALARIFPDLRVLDCPGLFRTLDEKRFVRDKLFNGMADELQRRGYTLLDLHISGAAYIFSKTEAKTPDDFIQRTAWTWKGDAVMEIMLKSLGIKNESLKIADVYDGLKKGMMDTYVFIPSAAVNLKWYEESRFMIDRPFYIFTAGTVIRNQSFDCLSDRNRRLIKEEWRRIEADVIRTIQQDEKEGLEIIRKAGIETVSWAPDANRILDERMRQLSEKLVEQGVFSRNYFDQTKKWIADYRIKP